MINLEFKLRKLNQIKFKFPFCWRTVAPPSAPWLTRRLLPGYTLQGNTVIKKKVTSNIVEKCHQITQSVIKHCQAELKSPCDPVLCGSWCASLCSPFKGGSM